MLWEIVPLFKVQNRTTLRDCKVEVQQLLDEDLRGQLEAEDVPAARAMEERGQAILALWRTVFVHGGVQLPATTGDAVE